MAQPRILAFAGSARRESFNKRLLKIAVAGAEQAGAQVTVIDLRDYPLPIMDQDLEAAEGPPANATALKSMFMENDGLLLACPEYNSSITPLLKNTIDWVSRPGPNNSPPGLAAFKNKVAVLMSASPGALGGLRGLVTVRSIFGNIGVIVLPDQIAISVAHDAFSDDGRLKDTGRHAAVENLGRALATLLGKL
jgi:chromate reductase, NAD(P)H dehydrogenase (quinone)